MSNHILETLAGNFEIVPVNLSNINLEINELFVNKTLYKPKIPNDKILLEFKLSKRKKWYLNEVEADKWLPEQELATLSKIISPEITKWADEHKQVLKTSAIKLREWEDGLPTNQ